MSRPGRITHSTPADRTTTTVSRSGRSEITSSTCCLTGMNLPFRRAPSGRISALARETSSRSRTAVAAKPPKTTVCGAPMRAQASMAMTTSGIIGR